VLDEHGNGVPDRRRTARYPASALAGRRGARPRCGIAAADMVRFHLGYELK
jgi:hypothetical protein